jgi:hypothetical protein
MPSIGEEMARAPGLFVGRERELVLFDGLLAPDGPMRVLFVRGPGGVGKSSLLRVYAERARALDRATLRYDAEHCGTAAAPAIEWLESELAALPELARLTALIALDGFEDLEHIEPWLRHAFIPSLPSTARVVIAGRHGPSMRWRTDGAWAQRMVVHELENLSAAEANALLARSGVAAAERGAIAASTHGHALALVLAAERLRTQPPSTGRSIRVPFELADQPDIVRSLVLAICSDMSSSLRRRSLDVACIARTTTEPLLRTVLDVADASAEFQWLERQPYMFCVSDGVVPHAIVRDVVSSDLRRRDRSFYDDIHRRLHTHLRGLSGAEPGEQAAPDLDVLRDVAFLHRRHASLRSLFSFNQCSSYWADRASSSDLAVIAERFADPRDRSHLERWRRHQPGALTIFRDDDGDVAGYELVVAVHEGDVIDDPAVALAQRVVGSIAPLRAREVLHVTRDWDSVEGQVLGDVQSEMWLHRVRHIGRTRALAASVVFFRDPDRWAPAFSYMGFVRLAELDLPEEGLGGFYRDWRAEPPAAWAERMARLAAGDEIASSRASAGVEMVVLPRDEFARAVKRALWDYPDREALADNPLARAKLVRVAGGGGTRGERLALALEEALDHVRANSRLRKAYRALKHAFVTPSGTQAQAASAAGMPFSTYRRQLGHGIDEVTARLWERETGEKR